MLEALSVQNQILNHPLLDEKGIELAIKRLELVHPIVSGNKFFKLKYNLDKAVSLGFNTILTFGGAFSNHILATAQAAKASQLRSIGIIRGDEIRPLNPTLGQAETLGMSLHFVDRVTYRLKKEVNFLNTLETKFGQFYLIPEGGTNVLAIQGTAEIMGTTDRNFSHITTCIGTGGTFAGLFASLNVDQNLLGFSALKGEFIHQEINRIIEQNQLSSSGAYKIFTNYHFGGYAKYTQELIDFIWWFFENFGIVLDPIYTGKMAFGIWDLVQKGHFNPGSKVLMIHSGGLQGNVGFTELTGIPLPIR
jgi:1-aminocyclopropane-1-carboxylate deaminase/D-cysteine desulfhydrase-like pyridoxal-dependent ACC family enzyme